MNFLVPALIIAALAVAAIAFPALRNKCLVTAINIGEGTHVSHITKLAGAVILQPNLLCKFGADSGHVVIADANDVPIGVLTDEAEFVNDPVDVALLGAADSTRLFQASEAVSAGDFLVPAANGKVRKLPAAAGTYTLVGRALQDAKAGDVVEGDPIPCIKQAVA